MESSGVGEHLKELTQDGILEVVLDRSLQGELSRIAERESCQIAELAEEAGTLKVALTKKAASRKAENCMVCGGHLEYLTTAVEVVCNYCGRKETGYVRCPAGHYVCELCHGKGAYDMVKDIALSTGLRDPLEIAETMMSHPNIPMLGCEHAIITAGALMAALRNKGSLNIGEGQILEAMNRAQRQAISAYCGLTGVCGIPIAVGAVFSVLLGAECPKDRELSIVMHCVARAIDAIANEAGPCCCKGFVRTGIVVACNLAKEHLAVRLPIRLERMSCSYVKRHPHGCRASRCHYFPKKIVAAT